MMNCLPLNHPTSGDLPTGFSCFALPAALYLAAFRSSQSTIFFLSHTRPLNGHPVLAYAACLGVGVGLVLMLACPVVDTYLFAKACASGEGCSSY